MPKKACAARHRLAWVDQLAYELFMATRRSQLVQCLWLYDRDVNVAAVKRSIALLSDSAFNRHIEPSSLPFGRPRWVRPVGNPVELMEEAQLLPRSALLDWANRHARLPLDPLRGPAWRMALQRFDDGTTALSAVVSHLLLDGKGGLSVLEAAARGLDLPSPYQRQDARSRIAALIQDIVQVLTDAPRSLRALGQLALVSWRSPGGGGTVPAPAGAADSDEFVELPALSLMIDANGWEVCAKRLGGRVSTLLPGFVAVLASRLGRCRPTDGTVSVLVPVDRRQGLEDHRALAIEFHSITLPSVGLTRSLAPVNRQFKALLRGAKADKLDALAPLLPAVAWMPRSVVLALVDRLFNYSEERTVSCSNLGTLPDDLGKIDGGPCDEFLARAVDVNVTRRDLARSHGHLVVVGSRFGSMVCLSIEACQLDPAPTTLGELRRAVEQTLADFNLKARIEM